MKVCSVCRQSTPRRFGEFGGKLYWRCERCAATLLDPAHFISPKQALAHYRHHENDPSDPGYRDFLRRLMVPLQDHLKSGMRGLDYGCGPGPALVAMMSEAGFEIMGYDPLFAPDTSLLDGSYDFVTCSEVAEHWQQPFEEFNLLERLLRPRGLLGIMTCFQTDDGRFADWYYRRDPTHVVFYREETFRCLACDRGWSCRIAAKDVAILGMATNIHGAHGLKHG